MNQVNGQGLAEVVNLDVTIDEQDGGDKLLGREYAWGTWGDFPGGFWGVHVFSTDMDGNFYVSEVDKGGAQKFRPRQGVNPNYLIGKPLRVAWK
jgi:hypothetical protein